MESLGWKFSVVMKMWWKS